LKINSLSRRSMMVPAFDLTAAEMHPP